VITGQGRITAAGTVITPFTLPVFARVAAGAASTGTASVAAGTWP
jgi:hypothetical protein